MIESVKQQKNKIKKQKVGSFAMSIETLGASMLGNMLTGKGATRTGKGLVRTGTCYNKGQNDQKV